MLRAARALPRSGGGAAIGARLAWRNLTRDRVRFVVTLAGISFSVVLMLVQSGLLIGFVETTTALVTHAEADFWIVARGTANVDQSLDFPDRRRFKALSVPGVEAVDRLVVHFVPWRRPDGRTEPIIVVGFDLATGAGGPWNLVAGSLADLHLPDAVAIDRLYAGKLGVSGLGQTVEIAGKRARIVGYTIGIRAFTQSPYVFTSLKSAQAYSGLGADRVHYLLVRARADADRTEVARRLRLALPTSDVLSAPQFARMTARYWLLTTGAGAALVLGAVLGLIVGVIIVAQTLYAATVERLAEFATLRAIGASNAYLDAIVLRQALAGGALGYLAGLAISLAVAEAAARSTVALLLPWSAAAAVGLVTLAMCAGAALVAIRRVKAIDPTLAFR
jgi:putative ABC transport system permease protein